jgi:hypothetical protein
MGLVALHDRVQTTTTTLDCKTFTTNKMQRHGCYQPTPIENTPYDHFTFITKILTWVQGRLGLVAVHDRVQTTTITADGKTFTANKVQRHGCYEPTPMWNTPYGHSILMRKILTWVHGRMGLVALHERVQPPQQPHMARHSQPIKCKDMDATNQHQWGTPVMTILHS